MKILVCSPNPLDPRLGAPKVIIEVAECMNRQGEDCRLVSDTEVCPGIGRYHGMRRALEYSRALREFVRKAGPDYDVVDYDHAFLPYSRSEFSPRALLVARSVLLAQHFDRIALPRFRRLRSQLGAWVKGPVRFAERSLTSVRADLTCAQADLINVSNEHDRAELRRRGFADGRIVVIPFGLTRERLAAFDGLDAAVPPGPPRVAFVGTFDARKGGAELPEIVEEVARAVPEVKFKLLGARYRTEAETLAFFPQRLHRHLELVSRYAPEELPRLLSDCAAGIFPSHVEGFGFGVLEMLAAGLPVIAYDAPGPPMMLPPPYLAPRGDARELSRRLAALLRDPAGLASARRWARNRAADFGWEEFARRTVQAYATGLEKLRSAGPPREAVRGGT